MLIILSRSQKTAIGQLRADVVYDFDEKDAGHMKVAENLLRDGGFGKELSKAAVEKLNKEAERLAQSKEDEDLKSAVEAAGLADVLAENDVLKGQLTEVADNAEQQLSDANAKLETATQTGADLEDALRASTEQLVAAETELTVRADKISDLEQKLAAATKTKATDK